MVAIKETASETIANVFLMKTSLVAVLKNKLIAVIIMDVPGIIKIKYVEANCSIPVGFP